MRGQASDGRRRLTAVHGRTFCIVQCACTRASLLARSRPSRHDDCQDGHWMLPWWGVWPSLTAQPCCTPVGMGLICPLRDDPAGAKRKFSICSAVPYAADNSTDGTRYRLENALPANIITLRQAPPVRSDTGPSLSSCPSGPSGPSFYRVAGHAREIGFTWAVRIWTRSQPASHPAKPGSKRYHKNKRGKGLMGWLTDNTAATPADRPVLARPVAGGCMTHL